MYVFVVENYNGYAWDEVREIYSASEALEYHRTLTADKDRFTCYQAKELELEQLVADAAAEELEKS